MSADERNLLTVLKAELEFIEKGGYRRLSWRPKFIFEDSPSCLNYQQPENQRLCSACALMKLVPPENRDANIPCRHIPLNEKGETLESLYHWASQEEMEACVTRWLKATIEHLEQQNVESESQPSIGNSAPTASSPSPPGIRAERMISMFSKCANPDCPTILDYRQGRFFRFHKDHPAGAPPPNPHSVQHFWLCHLCEEHFTLVYDTVCGVALVPRPERSSAPSLRRVIAAA